MIIDLDKVRVFVRPGKTDLRKAANGLSILAEGVMKQDPFSGSLFLFCNTDRKLLKILYWDRNGFCLWPGQLLRNLLGHASGQKRLEKDRFPWPESQEDAREINPAQLRMLLDGIDFWKAHRTLHYQTVAG